MRKFSKIFAALLTVVMLCGVLAVSVFAITDVADVETLKANQLKLTNATAYVSADFDTNNTLSASTSSHMGSCGKINKAATDANGNKYLRFYNVAATRINTSNGYMNVAPGNASTSGVGSWGMMSAGTVKYEYSVIDFDFGTDRYTVKVGKEIVTTRVSSVSSDKLTTTTTYTYAIQDAYRTYTPDEFTKENIEADIEEAYDALEALQADGSILSKNVTVKDSAGAVVSSEDTNITLEEAGIDLSDTVLESYKWTYDQALATKSLALISDSAGRFYGQNSRKATESDTAFTRSSTGADVFWVYNQNDGKWYYCNFASLAKEGAVYTEMSNQPGVLDHFTIVTRVVAPTGDVKTTSGSVQILVFINGNLFTDTTLDVTSFGWEALRFNVSGATKTQDRYSYVMDNYAVYYYAKDYVSDSDTTDDADDIYGLDNYLENEDYKTEPLYTCEDIVYTKNYISPNGYLQVNNGDEKGSIVSIPDLVEAELLKIKNGSTVVTTMDLLDLDVPEGTESFKVSCDTSLVTVTLSDKSLKQLYVPVEESDGYTVRKANSDELVNLKWLDIKGNHITTTPIVFGGTPDPEFYNISPSAVVDGTIYYANVTGWEWSLDGEVGKLLPENVEAGATVTMTPVIEGDISSVADATFYMGVFYADTKVTAPVPASDGTYTFYSNQTAINLLTECRRQTYGNTCVLLADFTGEDGKPAALPASGTTSSIQIPEGYTVSLDLNGHVLVKDGLYNSDGNPIFYLKEGSTLNVYSSVPGGKIVKGHLRAKNRTNQIMSAGGIARINAGVDEACVNIGDLLDEDGNTVFKCGDNFTFIGGTAVVVTGTIDADGTNGTTEYDAFKALRNDKKITVNLNGGFYMSAARGTYAIVCCQAPDLVLNANGVTAVCSYTGGAFLHDYDSANKVDVDDIDGDGNVAENVAYYYATNTVATFENCNIYALKADEQADGSFKYTAANAIYRLDEESTATFRGCTVFGKIASSLKGHIYFGADNVIADGATGINFSNHSRIHYEDGVKAAFATDGRTVSATVTHPDFTIEWAKNMALTLKADANLDSFDGTVDTDAEAALLSDARLLTKVWKNTVTTVFESKLSFVTFTEVKDTGASADVSEITWKDGEGNTLTTTYEFIGATPTVPSAAASYDDKETYDWYVISYAWKNESGKTKVTGKADVFAPVASYKASIQGMKANVTLFTDMTYNLYVPVSENASGVSVEGATLNEATVIIGGVEYYIVSATPAIDEFDAMTATIKFTAEGVALEYAAKLDVMAYADAVAKAYTCGSEEATLVYEMVSYKEAVAKALYPEMEIESEALASFKAAHADCACALGEIEISDAEKNTSYEALKAKGVTGVAYVLSVGEIGMKIEVGEGVTVTSVSYVDALGRTITHTEEEGNLIARDGYYLVTGVSAAYIDNIMTITVDGVSGTYCLGNYITNNPEVTVAQNIYKYAQAAENYKNVTAEEKAAE